MKDPSFCYFRKWQNFLGSIRWMMSRCKLNSILFLIIMVFMASCDQRSEPTPQTEVPTQAALLPEEGYPVPADNPSPDIVYPGPSSGITNLATLAPGELPSAPSDAPQPKPGMSSISGTIYSFTSYIYIPDTTFYLTPALGENKEMAPLLTGPNPEIDIIGRTDSNGQFQLDNVPPGEYFIVIWAPYSWSPVVNPDKDPPPPVLIILEPDQKYPLGVLQISWP